MLRNPGGVRPTVGMAHREQSSLRSNAQEPHNIPYKMFVAGEDGYASVSKYGRHEETRTPDLYRVKACKYNAYSYLEGA